MPHASEIKRCATSFGPNATVLEPKNLVSEIRNDLRHMYEAYEPAREVVE